MIHCLKVSGAKMLLVDDDEQIKSRIGGERERMEEDLGMRPIILSEGLKNQIALKLPERPDDSYREGVKGNFPAALFYTRYVSLIIQWESFVLTSGFFFKWYEWSSQRRSIPDLPDAYERHSTCSRFRQPQAWARRRQMVYLHAHVSRHRRYRRYDNA